MKLLYNNNNNLFARYKGIATIGQYGQFVVSACRSRFQIDEFKIDVSKFPNKEMFRVLEKGELNVGKANISRSEFHQAFLALNDGLENRNRETGSFWLNNTIIINSTSKSTLFGFNHSRTFSLVNLTLIGNSVENIIHGDNSSVHIHNVKMLRNRYKSGFSLATCHLTLKNVHLEENFGRGHGKGLIYESDCMSEKQMRSVDIENLYISVFNHPDHDERSAILDIEINDIVLSIKNTTVDIQHMDHARVFAIHLKFATLSQHVLQERNDGTPPAITLRCPPGYNPSNSNKLRRTFYTHRIECVPCPKGSYTLERGFNDIRYVDNIGYDTVTWRNGNRTLLVQGKPYIGKCFPCPPGGNCTNGIKSQGNYYGLSHSLEDDDPKIPSLSASDDCHETHLADNYLLEDCLKNAHNHGGSNAEYGGGGGAGGRQYTMKNTVATFLPCPPGYCCSNRGQPCTSITSCNYNRRGILCGTCVDGFFESYFSTDCISVEKCTQKNRNHFWTGLDFYFYLFISSYQSLASGRGRVSSNPTRCTNFL